jgi:hypothetical protein
MFVPRVDNRFRGQIRAVTHLDVSVQDIQVTIEAVGDIASGGSRLNNEAPPPRYPARGVLKQACQMERPRGTADIVVRAVSQFGLPGGWLRITFVESLLVPVGIDGSFVTNGVQAGDFFRRQFPT